MTRLFGLSKVFPNGLPCATMCSKGRSGGKLRKAEFMREHYILRFTGSGAKPADQVQRVKKMPGVVVLDESPRMLLIESSDTALAELSKSLPDWNVTPESYVPLPDTRKHIRNFVK